MSRTPPKLSPEALEMLEDVYGDDALNADERDPDDLMLSTSISLLLQWYKEFDENHRLHQQIADLKQEVERLRAQSAYKDEVIDQRNRMLSNLEAEKS
jgi:hypothetical protein